MSLPDSIIAFLGAGAASGLGSYVGMKTALTRLETWKQEVVDPKLNKLVDEVAVHSDDLLAHDMEIGQTMSHLGLERVRRQKVR